MKFTIFAATGGIGSGSKPQLTLPRAAILNVRASKSEAMI